MLTAFEQVLSLLELLSLELAPKDGSALQIDPVCEVLTGDADALTLPVLQLLVLDVAPFLHHQHASSTNALARDEGGGASHPVYWVASPSIWATLIVMTVVATAAVNP